MGLEAECTVSHGSRSANGKVHYGCGRLDFRGEFRLDITTALAQGWACQDGVLSCLWQGETAAFELGTKAARWLEAIRSPPKLLAKLGLKQGHRVWLRGLFDDEFLGAVDGQGCQRVKQGPADAVLQIVEEAHQLDLDEAQIERNGMLWVLWPKGRKHFGENHIRQRALRTNLVDVKVAAFDARLSALKLVIRRDRR